MINKITTIKITLAALLLAMNFISSPAQDNDEVVITPQLKAVLETPMAHSLICGILRLMIYIGLMVIGK